MIKEEEYEDFLQVSKEYEKRLGVEYLPGMWGNIEQMRWCIKEGKPVEELIPELKHVVF